ncbi:MAG: aminoglycoside phosphotransferase family protein [Candidatus Heimdallarchaeota archaeon]|nr:aminoglycoside phosphotransferase family protein [Candidatus Heimdallarchaeota archaeon]
MSYKTKRPLSKKTVQKLLLQHFPHQSVESFQEVPKSFVNKVYSFRVSSGEEYILKVNNPHWPEKQRREALALTLVKEQTSIPVPMIYAQSPPKSPISYLILEKVPGVELKDALREGLLEQTTALKLFKEVGRYLGELQKISFDFFGDFSVGSLSHSSSNFLWGRTFPTFKECLRAFAFEVLNWVDTNTFPAIRKKLHKVIPTYLEQIHDPSSPCLVHSDIQASNILIQDGTISALLDFEWAFAGTSSFDLTLAKAGFYFSTFPSLAPNSSPLALTEDNYFKEISRALDAGFQSSSSQPVIPYPEDFPAFVWLLYLIGSWRWTTRLLSFAERRRLKRKILSLSAQFF